MVNLFPYSLGICPQTCCFEESCPCLDHYSFNFLRIVGIVKELSFHGPFCPWSFNEFPPTSPSLQWFLPMLEANPCPLCISGDCRIVMSGHHCCYNRYLGKVRDNLIYVVSCLILTGALEKPHCPDCPDFGYS